MPTFSQRLANYRKRSGLSREEIGQKLGVTGKYVGMIERGEKEIDDDSTISKLLGLLDREPGSAPPSEGAIQTNTSTEAVPLAWVGVISWAHAGNATSYEELPSHWQDQIPVTYSGRRAFGLLVEGDSMEPRCMSGDVVVVTPDEELRNGCLVVAKLRNDGVVLRRFTKLNDEAIRLIPYNTIYPSVDYTPRDFHWIYPVHSTVRREWN